MPWKAFLGGDCHLILPTDMRRSEDRVLDKQTWFSSGRHAVRTEGRTPTACSYYDRRDTSEPMVLVSPRDTGAESPDILEIASTTADIVITGWRLSRIADGLRDGDLLSGRTKIDKSKNAPSFSARYRSVSSMKQ